MENKADEIHKLIREARDKAEAHAGEATDPKCAALCSTSYEVLAGLEEAYDHYLQKQGKAWE